MVGGGKGRDREQGRRPGSKACALDEGGKYEMKICSFRWDIKYCLKKN